MTVSKGSERGKAQAKSPKVLLLYASAGAGHRSACEAIRQSIQDLHPEFDIIMVDILQFMPSLLGRLYSRGYVHIASKLPRLWYLIYESGSDLSRFKPTGFWHDLFWRTLLGSFFEFLKSNRPDYIVSCHFLSSWAAGTYKLKFDSHCAVSTVVTDYGIHPVWITPGQDIVFVATDQLKAELAPFQQHLGTNRIEAVGIPIHPVFGRRKDISRLRKKFQLDPARHTILILGTMFPSSRVWNILLGLAECQNPIQIILVAGRHYPMPEYVREKLIEKEKKCQLYGYVDFMDELMAVSDVAITKAGALTTSECLASGLPLVIVRPYPGQEERNCDYLLEKGAAVRVEQLPGLSYKIDSVISEPGRLEAMKTCALKIANPNSSARLTKLLFDSRG